MHTIQLTRTDIDAGRQRQNPVIVSGFERE